MRTHHALADGMAIVRLLQMLTDRRTVLDATPAASVDRLPGAAAPWALGPRRPTWRDTAALAKLGNRDDLCLAFTAELAILADR